MKNMQDSAPSIDVNEVFVIDQNVFEPPKKQAVSLEENDYKELVNGSQKVKEPVEKQLNGKQFTVGEVKTIPSSEEAVANANNNSKSVPNNSNVAKSKDVSIQKYEGDELYDVSLSPDERIPESPPKCIDDRKSGDEYLADVNDGVQDSGLESAASSWDRTLAEVKEHAFARLQDELKKAHEELKLRDEEVSRLNRIRSEVESELEELTASLFQEAHNMVREANIRQAVAEKTLKETLMQVDVLSAEVVALKSLVLTSTPSRPNPHLHPQINRDDGGIFKRHRRSPSHFNLKYGRENSPPESPVKEYKHSLESADVKEEALEVDHVVHKEFLAWKQHPTLDKTDEFIARIYKEDIDYCLDFSNTELSKDVREAVESGEIFIEAVSDKARNNFPKKCALLEAVRHCQYRLRLGSNETWYSISHMCRNRIIAVCDFLNYLRYIQRGLVKSSVHDIYWEIVRLRKEMSLARLGLALSS